MTHNAFTWDGTNLIAYKDGTKYNSVAASFTADPFRYIFLGYDRAGGAGRDADVTWGDFRMYATALSQKDIKSLYSDGAKITKEGVLVGNQVSE